jgi:hypothetical protein
MKLSTYVCSAGLFGLEMRSPIMVQDPASARAKVAKALQFVHQRQRETMVQVGKVG